jgi:hypothetical protein
MSEARQTELQELEHESVVEAKTIINSDHAYIHRGIGFMASLDIGGLAAAAGESYSFKTPAAKYIHLKNLELIGIGAGVSLAIIRGTTADPLVVASAGDVATELTGPHNANDNTTTASGVVIKKTPTYTDNKDGAVWDSIRVLGTSTNQFKSTATEGYSDNFELVLKSNTYYILTFTNLSAGGGDAATQVYARMFWYEENEGVV